MSLYRRLLRVLSPTLERHYGAAMEDVFLARRDDARRRGGWRLMRFWIRETGGLVSVAWKAGHMQRVAQNLWKDVRFACRLMRRAPGFTAIVLLTLAIGTGANAVMFSVVNTVLLRPLPYSDPERLTLVRPVLDRNRSPQAAAAPDFYRFRAENRSFDHLDAFYGRAVNLTGGADPERVSAMVVSSGFFDSLGVQPPLGRAFAAADESWGSHRVAVLSAGLWQRRFGGDPAIVGRTLTINGEPHVVAGVLAPTFSFLNAEAQLFLPLSFAPGDNMNSHNNYFLRLIGRLKPGVSRQQAVTDLNVISNDIIAREAVNKGTSMSVEPLQDIFVANVRRPVLILFGAVGFVLLISCANLANLLLARAVARQKEIAVRLAIGASRVQLVRQLLVESVILAITGGALGLAIADASIGVVNAISPQVLPRAEAIRVDPTVLLFTVATAALTGIVMGLAPAFHGTRADLAGGLKDSSRTASDSGGHHRLRATMVVAEVALSLVLLAGAGLMIKSIYLVLKVDAGFDSERVLTLQINLPPQKYIDQALARQFNNAAAAKATAFFESITERTRHLHGVEAVGAINGLPLMGEVWGKQVTLLDRPLPADTSGLGIIQYRVVTGEYFRAMGVRILNGRAFNEHDTADAPKVAIVNRTMASRDWPGQDPVGKQIIVDTPRPLLPARVLSSLPADYSPPRLTVVGVAADTHYSGLTTAAVPLVYAPFSQGSQGTANMYLVVRAGGDPLALAAPIRDEVKALDPDQPVSGIETMESRVATSVARPRLQTTVLGVFALVAILLAAVGIYGVMSYTVSQRAQEIGIRLALGAGRGQVLGLVLRSGLAMVTVGIAVGLGAALALSRVLQTLLFEVSTTDPAVFGGIALLLFATAGVAAWIPARRAARLDPIAALRAE